MNEINIINFPKLESFQTERERLRLPYLDVELLTAQAGSQDVLLANQARKELDRKWDLTPENDSLNVPTVDLMAQLEPFSEEARKRLANNLVAIQLTEGCNGNCPFCLFGNKKGVSAKYSASSVHRYLREYSNEIPKSLALYWDSDPFDYREEVEGKVLDFTDIYKEWRSMRPTEFQYVSTAIPRGGKKVLLA
ncbi:MAG: hypothetical protein WCO06_05785 [Candidatus Roizmanbacteria bacterium]